MTRRRMSQSHTVGGARWALRVARHGTTYGNVLLRHTLFVIRSLSAVVCHYPCRTNANAQATAGCPCFHSWGSSCIGRVRLQPEIAHGHGHLPPAVSSPSFARSPPPTQCPSQRQPCLGSRVRYTGTRIPRFRESLSLTYTRFLRDPRFNHIQGLPSRCSRKLKQMSLITPCDASQLTNPKQNSHVLCQRPVQSNFPSCLAVHESPNGLEVCASCVGVARQSKKSVPSYLIDTIRSSAIPFSLV
ncbi:hypothetical protein BGZ61DRAFT_135781 [Ilyonectria robusta]|uniref:uncharacterized protein n=1 Tax=Ilyonectria robusta TaxID=1079257 RepID=UPI001E8CCC86|nr:uncharacterized protein BGZ61DRAFT_135781 [Ilyonectria robusta]KAH8735139.1 hypothetical protein BGZ61DRAFT_135781 [Ilyonectria robusta]